MFRSMLHSLVTKGLVALINFLLLIISARYLGASSRGEISIFILNIMVIQVINDIYTGHTLVYFVSRFDLRKIIISGLIYSWIVCSLCNAAIAAVHRQVPGFEWIGYLVSLLVIVNTFNCVLLLGKEKISSYNFLSLLQPFLLLCGLLAFVFILKDVTFRAYVYPLLISFAAAVCISGALVARLLLQGNGGGRPFEWKPVLASGIYYQAGILMFLFCKRYSYYLLANNAEIGQYSSAVSLMESVLIITTAASPVLLARVAGNGQAEKNAGLTLSIAKACFGLSGVAALTIFALPAEWFTQVLGTGFAGTRQLMLHYLPAVLMACVCGIFSGYFSAVGRQRVVLVCNSAGFAVALVLTPLMVAHFQASGAAYATGISYLVIAMALVTTFFKSNRLSFMRLLSPAEKNRP